MNSQCRSPILPLPLWEREVHRGGQGEGLRVYRRSTPHPVRSPRRTHHPLPQGERVRRHGYSLLEVVLAMTILVGALVALNELVGLGARHAREAVDLTTAQLLCESKLAEVTAGILPPSAITGAPCEADPEWQYSLVVEPTADTTILAVHVTVRENRPGVLHPVEFTLSRWMRDPTVLAAVKEAAEAAESSSTSSTSGGNSSTGGGSSSSGGT